MTSVAAELDTDCGEGVKAVPVKANVPEEVVVSYLLVKVVPVAPDTGV